MHSLTTQGVTLDVAMAPRIRRTRISDYLTWSQAWVVYFEATVRYHPHLLPHLAAYQVDMAGAATPQSANPRRVAPCLRLVRGGAAASAGTTTPGRARGPPADTNTAAHDAVAHTLRFPVHLND